MSWMCPHCGSRTYHYDQNRIQNRCDGCGRPVDDQQQNQQQMQYDRSLASAMDHLRAGNWSQTISLLRPLMSQRPTDVRLYKAQLQAATKNYTDTEMRDPALKNHAYEAWEKLLLFHALDGNMTRFGNSRYNLYLNKLSDMQTDCYLYMGLAVVCFVIIGFLTTIDLFAYILLTGMILGIVKACKLHPFLLSRALREARNAPNANPFYWRFP